MRILSAFNPPSPAIVFLISSAACIPSHAEKSILIPTTVSFVRLHPSEAWITRSGSSLIREAGIHRIAIAKLPTDLKLDDIRLSVRGPAGTRLGEITLDPSPTVYQSWPEWKRMEARLSQIAQESSLNESQKSQLATQRRFAQELASSQLQNAQQQLGSGHLQPHAVMDVLDFIQTRQLELGRLNLSLEEEGQKLEQEKTELQNACQKLQAEATANANIATAEIELKEAGPIEVSLAYRSGQASWNSTYEARLSADRTKLEFVAFAAIHQETGENWENVSIELANMDANPSISLPTVPVAPNLSHLEEKRTQAYPRLPEGNFRRANLAVMRIPGNVEIRKNEKQRFRLTSVDLVPRCQYLAIPRQSPDVHLVALVTPPMDFPLAEGTPVDLLHGTERLGTLLLERPMPGDPLHLSFGAVPGLIARRELFKRSHGEAYSPVKGNAPSKTKEREWAQSERLIVESTLPSEVVVEVQDRIVSSGTDSIRVDQDTDTTVGWNLVRPGIRRWSLHLKPNSSETIDIHTRIDAPLIGHIANAGELQLEDN